MAKTAAKQYRPRMVLTYSCSDSDSKMAEESEDLCLLLNNAIRKAVRCVEADGKHDIRGIIRFGFQTYDKVKPTCAGKGSLFRNGDPELTAFADGIPFYCRIPATNDVATITIGALISDAKMPEDYSSQRNEELVRLVDNIVLRVIRSFTAGYTKKDDEAALRTVESIIKSRQRGSKFYLRDLYPLCETYGIRDHDVIERALTKLLENCVVGVGESWSVYSKKANEYTLYELADLRPEWQKHI
ncbi:hypothetical protein IK110_04580 [Candidatus Saccharibacteria bacterium]|nr:hypothetical protein [Candidatus Saccharibacteria bacterium]